MTTLPPFTDVNLDAMDEGDLSAFATACGVTRARLSAARQLFPDQRRGYRALATLYTHYAWNRLTAMRCRSRGDITTALTYERICNDIYARIPSDARGW